MIMRSGMSCCAPSRMLERWQSACSRSTHRRAGREVWTRSITSRNTFEAPFWRCREYRRRAECSPWRKPSRFSFGLPNSRSCRYWIPAPCKASANADLENPCFREIGVRRTSTRTSTLFPEEGYQLVDSAPFVADRDNRWPRGSAHGVKARWRGALIGRVCRQGRADPLRGRRFAIGHRALRFVSSR